MNFKKGFTAVLSSFMFVSCVDSINVRAEMETREDNPFLQIQAFL